MVKDIIMDEAILSIQSVKVDVKDKELIQTIIKDLYDTAVHHKERCCGLAAVQIGYHHRIILVWNGQQFLPMINPIILKRSKGTYEVEEMCMSFSEPKMVTRYDHITVMYVDGQGKMKKLEAGTLLSQIIQHEVAHLNGELI